MKTIKKLTLFISVCAAVLLAVGCDKTDDGVKKEEPSIVEGAPNLTEIRIKEKPCEMLKYVGKIGDDFDSALNSLKKSKNISSDIMIEPLKVLFDYDTRQFFGIVYGDCGLYADVLDSKGNHYLRSHFCSEEM